MRSFIVLLLALVSGLAYAAEGMVVVRSHDDVKTTANHVVEEIQKRKLTVFMDLDHAEAAHQVGMDLWETRLIVFGSPKLGTLLMQCSQTMGMDLPVKMLVWKDEAGQVWLGYNDPAYLGARHGAVDCAALSPLGKAIESIARSAAGAN